jgi:hypothetical protein
MNSDAPTKSPADSTAPPPVVPAEMHAASLTSAVAAAAAAGPAVLPLNPNPLASVVAAAGPAVLPINSNPLSSMVSSSAGEPAVLPVNPNPPPPPSNPPPPPGTILPALPEPSPLKDKVKRKAWSFEQKLFAITLKETRRDISLDELLSLFREKFGTDVPKQTVCDWLQPKNVLKVKALARSSHGKRCRKARDPACPKLEMALKIWCRSQQALERDGGTGALLSGEKVIAKAKELSRFPQLQVHDAFAFSSGWQTNFKLRNGIRPLSRKAAPDSPESFSFASNSLLELFHILQPQNPLNLNDVFAMSETSLYVAQHPTRMLSSISRSSNKKRDVTKVTVGLSTNSTGTEKLPPIVIGKSQRPRGLSKNTNIFEKLGMHYYWNNNSWMTSSIFRDWISKVDRQFAQQQRHIFLLLDAAPSHILPDEEQLTIKGFEVYKREYVTVIFLPNFNDSVRVATPLNLGLFVLFKSLYRQKFVQWVTHRLQNPESVEAEQTWTLKQYRPDFLQFLTWIQQSWESVSAPVVSTCWGRSGIMSEKQSLPSPPATVQVPEDGVHLLQVEIDRLEKAIEPRKLVLLDHDDNLVQADSYIELETEVAVHAALTDEEIVRIVTSDLTDSSGIPEALINMNQKPKTSATDAMNLATTVLNYMAWHSDCFDHNEVELMSGLAEKLSKQDAGMLVIHSPVTAALLDLHVFVCVCARKHQSTAAYYR